MMKTAMIVAMAMAVACGKGGASASASVTGSVHGSNVQSSSAISGAGTINNGNGTTNVALILLSNDGALCGDATANKQPKNLETMIIALSDVNASTGATSVPVAAGDYPVYGGNGTPGSKIAVVFFERTDATCQTLQAQSAKGTSGVVHLTGVNNGAFTGTFDITVTETDASGNLTSTTDHLTGSFNPASCAGLNAALNNSANPTCY